MKNENKNEKLVKIINIAICAAILLALGILAWVLPQPTYSEYERRDLEQMPKFSFEKLFSGEFTKGIEISYADTFAFRDYFVEFASLIDEAKGIHESGTIYGQTPATDNTGNSEQTESLPDKKDDIEIEPSEENIKNNVEDENSEATEQEQPEKPEELEEPEEPDDGVSGETIAGIFVYKGMGFELLGRSDSSEAYYASTVNKYRDALPDSVKVYNMVVPKHAEFSLPKKYASLTASAKDCIDNIYSQIDDKVIKVDAYSVLKEHKNEYIYFNPDHHWTGLGAYYAYTAFCDAAGLTAFDYSDYTKHKIEGFVGTLYTSTMDNEMKNNPDYVEWCEVPVESTSYQYDKKGNLQSYTEVPVMASYASGTYSYGVYLHGDFPLTIVKTDVNNGRKCAVIKESYGNALSTYIAANFEETYIVDERYFPGNIVDFVNENGITDLLIINNVSAANANYHIGNIENLLTQKYSGEIAYPED